MKKAMPAGRQGFTLVELLVVIAVLSTAGLLVLSVFTSSLRGSNKAQILSSIKKNGQSVLDTMDKTIRGADNLVCPLTSASQTLVVVKDGIYTRYKFIPANTPMNSPTGTCSSANGCILQDNPVKQTNQETGEEETEAVFITDVCLATSLMARVSQTPATALTDTDPASGVSVVPTSGGSFIANPSSGFKNQIMIKFSLTPGVGAPAATTGQIDPVSFETTVNLR